MPDSMGSMSLVELTDLTCASPGYVEYLHISFAIPSTEDISLPAINTSFLWLDYMSTVAYDLSAMTASSVSMPAFSVWSELEWPLGFGALPWILSVRTFASMAFHLEFLRMGLVEGCLPPFPNGLSSLHFTSTTPCIPNWPDSLVSIYPNFGEQITEANATFCSVLSTCPGSYPASVGVSSWTPMVMGSTTPGSPAIATSERNRATQWKHGGLRYRMAHGEIGVAPGVYVVNAAVNHPYFESMTPATHSADVHVMGSIDVGNDFAVTLHFNIADSRTWLWAVLRTPWLRQPALLSPARTYGNAGVGRRTHLTFDAMALNMGRRFHHTCIHHSDIGHVEFPAMSIGNGRPR
ncbi:MAG: hypothetical protein IPF64_18080 [Flavobacteriales bacterium]|nr:hypothetical protein [Flavobacteriales bacterium]